MLTGMSHATKDVKQTSETGSSKPPTRLANGTTENTNKHPLCLSIMAEKERRSVGEVLLFVVPLELMQMCVDPCEFIFPLYLRDVLYLSDLRTRLLSEASDCCIISADPILVL